MSACSSGGPPAARYLSQVETAMMIALGAGLALALVSAAADSLTVAGLCLAALLRSSVLAAALVSLGKSPERRRRITLWRGRVFVLLSGGLIVMAGLRWSAPGWPEGPWVAAAAAGALAFELGLRKLMRAEASLSLAERLNWTAGIPLIGLLAGLALTLRGDGRADLIAAGVIALWLALEAGRTLRGLAAA